MPEIAGDAAIFVNPYSINEIRLAILKLMNDQLLYDNLVQMGLNNIKRFEINNIFKKYCTLYDSFKII
jgi:glycosyltransferase involved in cell wall biosynthesis